MTNFRRWSPLAAVLTLLLPTVSGAQTVRSAVGTTAASILPTVDQFRVDLGNLNANVAGSFGSGRREINWDGVPDAFASPNNLPANFFNVNSPRGVLLGTPGTGFRVSANAGNPSGTPIEFGEIRANYPDIFAPFSSQRLFTAIGSNIVDVSFVVPGASTAALTRGFGAVFSDVDLPNTTSIEYFGVTNQSLGIFFAEAVAANESFSFLGVSFADARISRVRITNGNQILAPNNNSNDLVVMDDFIYGEPVAVPEPSSLAMIAVGGLTLAAHLVRRQRRSAGVRGLFPGG